jgi:hypothetical protein
MATASTSEVERSRSGGDPGAGWASCVSLRDIAAEAHERERRNIRQDGASDERAVGDRGVALFGFQVPLDLAAAVAADIGSSAGGGAVRA